MTPTTQHDSTLGAGFDLAEQLAETGHAFVDFSPGDATRYRVLAALVDGRHLMVALVGHRCDEVPMLGESMYPQHSGYIGAKFGPAISGTTSADRLTELLDYADLRWAELHPGTVSGVEAPAVV